MTLRLGEHLDSLEGTELGEKMRTITRRVERRAGTSLAQVEIKSVAELGDAAGTCDMETDKIALRADVAAANNNAHFDAERYEHALRHETVHQQEEIHSEGVTELLTVDELHVEPVPAYRDYVRGARVLVSLLGLPRVKELASEENHQVALTQAVFAEKIANNMDAFAALEESIALVEAAG